MYGYLERFSIAGVAQYCIRAKWSIRPAVVSCFCTMKRLRIFLLHLYGMLLQRGTTPSIKFAGNPFINLGEESHFQSKLSCSRTRHVPGHGSKPDPEANELTMRPSKRKSILHSLGDTIGLQIPRQYFTQSAVKLRPIVIRSQSFSRVSRQQHCSRDLKHQDGRWRRGRHIRVKAEARPASRYTRLSILSNTATAT